MSIFNLSNFQFQFSISILNFNFQFNFQFNLSNFNIGRNFIWANGPWHSMEEMEVFKINDDNDDDLDLSQR